MTTANVQIIPKLIPMFSVPYGDVDYRVLHGGRGSGKTLTMAKMVCIYVLSMAVAGKSGTALCAREFLNSLSDSTLAEIKAAIDSEPDLLKPWFDVGEKYVRTRNLPGRVDFVFVGLRHNVDSVKSTARVLITWVDEAENVSEIAWRKLIPTVMRFGGEIFISYNPESVDSATHKRFRANASERILIEQVNYNDNPWFPEALERERQDDYKYRPETAGHIWEGDFLTLTEAQVFAGKFRQEAMEPPEGATPYFGLDFGFSNDPFAAVRIYKIGRVLLWRREAYKKGVLINRLGEEVRKGLGDDVARYDIIADSSRPDDIGYLKQPINVSGGSFQLPRIKASVKGKGSVEAGVEFIKSHDNVIHPDCPNTFKEFKLYQYKVDKQSGSVLPVLLDSYNHCMVAGTMVATGRGDVPIEEVNSDDYVMTREGLRRVKFAGATGVAKRVLKVSTTNGDFTCTPGHRVYTSNGFVRADSLCAGDELTALGKATANVLSVTDAGIADLVYDISVDEVHEFFANGILVHNCIDAARYALEPILRNQKFNWAAVS